MKIIIKITIKIIIKISIKIIIKITIKIIIKIMMTNSKKQGWAGATSLIRVSWLGVGRTKPFIIMMIIVIMMIIIVIIMIIIAVVVIVIVLMMMMSIFCFMDLSNDFANCAACKLGQFVLLLLGNCRELSREEFCSKPPINILSPTSGQLIHIAVGGLGGSNVYFIKVKCVFILLKQTANKNPLTHSCFWWISG